VIVKQTPPRYLSSDNDRLFRFQRWRANLRIMDVDEIKAVPCMPLSHPFVERLIGTVRREDLDRTFFWNHGDLDRKLAHYQAYYDHHRCHTGLAGGTPAQRSGLPAPPAAKLESYTWRQHCRGLFSDPNSRLNWNSPRTAYSDRRLDPPTAARGHPFRPQVPRALTRPRSSAIRASLDCIKVLTTSAPAFPAVPTSADFGFPSRGLGFEKRQGKRPEPRCLRAPAP
jgi:hypothetical protein